MRTLPDPCLGSAHRRGCGGRAKRASGSLPAWLIGLMAWLPLQPARAEASLAQCRRWQSSSGPERIELGNAVGAAAYLTKVKRFAESDPEHPQLLYSPADLQRACDGWR